MNKEEEMCLRELAAERCVIPEVTARLGPMSLWSKDGLEAEIRRAVEAEREACAKICDEFPDVGYVDKKLTADYHSYLIRQRGQE